MFSVAGPATPLLGMLRGTVLAFGTQIPPIAGAAQRLADPEGTR